LPNVWYFSIDVIVLHTHFAVLQIIGFAALFIFYTGELMHFYCFRTQTGEEQTNNKSKGV